MAHGCEEYLCEVERATERLTAVDPLDFSEVERALRERAAAIGRFSAALAACGKPESSDAGRIEQRIFQALVAGNHALVRLTTARQAYSENLVAVSKNRHALDAVRAGLGPAAASICEWSG